MAVQVIPILVAGGIALWALSSSKRKSTSEATNERKGEYRGLSYMCWTDPDTPLTPIQLPDGRWLSQQESNLYPWRGYFVDEKGGGRYGAYGGSGGQCEAMVKLMIDDYFD